LKSILNKSVSDNKLTSITIKKDVDMTLSLESDLVVYYRTINMENATI